MKKQLLNGFNMAILMMAANANADVYKCTYLDDAKRAQTVYTDAPCSKTAKKSLSDIHTASQEKSNKTELVASKVLPKPALRAVPENSETANQAVTRAVLAGDFKLAKQLATTKEHWRLIAIAEKPDATPNKLPQLGQTVYSQNNANPCEQAKADFESNSHLNWRDKDLINAKRSLMYTSCGIAEPTQPNTIVIGQSFPLGYGGGITTSRWIAPNAVGFGQHRPHQPSPYHRNFGTRYAPQGLSVGYQNRHFGVQFGNFSNSTSGYSNSAGW